MAFLCCHQKWSGAQLHMSEGDTREYDGTDISTSSVPHQLVHVHTLQNRSHINDDTQNKKVYTTQVQVSMSTVPMQQVCPERSQNASDKQQRMQANLVNGLHIKSTGSHEVLHHEHLTKIGCQV